jgi:hypothetical protein
MTDEPLENPIKKSIDDLLKEDINIESNSSSNLPAFDTISSINYDEMKSSSVNKSKKLMSSLLKFYLSQELIDNNEYIQAKAKLEVMTLSNLINQMNIAERAITTLMRSIDSGEVGPRMFEVLGGLQKTMLDIMRHQTLHLMAAEENMKKLKRDIDIYSNTIEIKTNQKIEASTVSRGTRDLMRDIQAELGNQEIEDPTDFDSENQSEL